MKTAAFQNVPRTLADENLLFTAMLDIVSAIIVIVNLDQHIVYVNRACEEATLCPSKEMMFQSIWKYFISGEVGTAKDLFRHVQETTSPLRMEMHWVSKYGTQRLIDWSVDSVTEEGIRLRHVVFAGVDITDRRRAEKRIREDADLIQNVFANTVQAFTRTVEKRDPFTAGHQKRVAELAVAIAGELGIPADRIEGIRFGSMIHDLGKIGIPAEILNRPGPLTNLEFSIIQTHPNAGYDIVKDLKFPWPIGEIILQHHERLDGSGYPEGLKGDEIILEARIIAVSDVIDAMFSHRPYRPALGFKNAQEALKDGRGITYDERVVDACLNLFATKGFQWNAS